MLEWPSVNTDECDAVIMDILVRYRHITLWRLLVIYASRSCEKFVEEGHRVNVGRSAKGTILLYLEIMLSDNNMLSCFAVLLYCLYRRLTAKRVIKETVLDS